MRTLKCIKGSLVLPKDKECRHIKMPWTTIIRGKPNIFGQTCERHFYRHKDLKQKPYVEEGTCWIDEETFKVIEVDNDD